MKTKLKYLLMQLLVIIIMVYFFFIDEGYSPGSILPFILITMLIALSLFLRYRLDKKERAAKDADPPFNSADKNF